MSESQPMPYPLRMSEELRAKVNALAKANNRSVNTELVLLLQEGLTYRQSGPVDAVGASLVAAAGLPVGTILGDVDALAEALAPKLAAKLKEKSS